MPAISMRRGGGAKFSSSKKMSENMPFGWVLCHNFPSDNVILLGAFQILRE